MRNLLAVSLILSLLLTAGCDARTHVAKDKALAKIDFLLGSIDVKRKEVELSVADLKDCLAGLRRAKITAQVKLDQIDRKIRPVEDRLSTFDHTLKALREHLRSASSVEIAGRTYSQDELKSMATQVIGERKGAAEQLSVLRDSQVRLKKVFATLERKQRNYEQRLSAIENRVAVIDASRIALEAMKEAGTALDGGEEGLERLEEKVNDLYAEVETELVFEDAKWDDSSMEKFIVNLHRPTDTIEAIDNALAQGGKNR